VSLAGTRPPMAPPEERSPVATTVVRTPAAAVGAGRRALAGRSVPEGPTFPRPAAWSPGAGAGRPAPAVRSGPEGSVPTAPQAVQSRHPRSARGRTTRRPTAPTTPPSVQPRHPRLARGRSETGPRGEATPPDPGKAPGRE
jgi:hypothetical protein